MEGIHKQNTETKNEGEGDVRTQTSKRVSLKNQSHFNNYSIWKDKLRENCYKRVREDRTRLLWKMRLPASQFQNNEDLIKSAFEDIYSDELKKIKDTSRDTMNISTSHPDSDDTLWEYDGLHSTYQGECENILLEMQRIFYEDLRVQEAEEDNQFQTWEDEDEYLARAVFENMNLNDEQVHQQTWCPVCKKGELLENQQNIYCTLCNLKLNKDNEVNLVVLRDRLAESHVEHLDRRGCRLKPEFCIETRFNLTALYIRCNGCNTFEVII